VVDFTVAVVLAAGFVGIAVGAAIEVMTVLYQLHFP